MAYQQRGLNENQERFHSAVIRDTRTLSMRINDSLKNPRHLGIFLIVLCLISFLMPALCELFFVIGVSSFIYCFTRKAKLPFKLPEYSGLMDYNDPKPGTHDTARKARGIYYFGNDLKSKQEMWFSNEDMRTHCLIFGSTGSGKTEALVSLAYNSLLQSSGFIYVDGKGDNSLFAKVFSMVRSMGRTDDLLLINFMTGARDIIGPQSSKLSNTLNPFSNGSSSMLAQLVISLMDKSAGSPDGDMWKGRAIGFVEAIMRVLVVMRDAGHILLDAHTVRQYFLLPKLEAMVIDKLFIRDGQEAISLENFPPQILEPIDNYLFNLPGYNKEKKGKQVSQVLEQHGFITMQLTRVFTSLADTYGHIMRTKLAEVDLKDVVLNRRILCVLLPALEKSPDELSNLGKVIIASLKAMMASGLGDQVEGSYADLVESKPTNAKTPYLCILDEYGYYAVEGFAVVPAQARSLGFSVIFAGQDLPAFQKASKEEAASIGANTNIKICMKLEDPTETWDFFMKSAGESYVTHVDSFQVDQGSVMGTYQDAKGARVEKRARMDLLDLKEQGLGEGHFLFKSKIIRGAFFFANPKPAKHMRINHFLKVEPPPDSEIKQMEANTAKFNSLVSQLPDLDDLATDSEELTPVFNVYADNSEQSPLNKALLSLQEHQKKDVFAGFFDDMEMDDDTDGLNVFAKLTESNHVKQHCRIKDDNLKQAVLKRTDTRDQIEYVQRLMGKTSQQAMNISLELINDMERGTQYPPKVSLPKKAMEVAATVKRMISEISLKKKEEEDKAE